MPITFLIIGIIGVGYGALDSRSKINAKTTQWYLQIDSFDFSPVLPNIPSDVTLRFEAEVNGQHYAYPWDAAWMHVGVVDDQDTNSVSISRFPKNGGIQKYLMRSVYWPLPMGEEKYAVAFSGYVQRGEGSANLRGQSPNLHFVRSLPATNGNFTVTVTDPNGSREYQTTVIFHYRITSDPH